MLSLANSVFGVCSFLLLGQHVAKVEDGGVDVRNQWQFTDEIVERKKRVERLMDRIFACYRALVILWYNPVADELGILAVSLHELCRIADELICTITTQKQARMYLVPSFIIPFLKYHKHILHVFSSLSLIAKARHIINIIRLYNLSN